MSSETPSDVNRGSARSEPVRVVAGPRRGLRPLPLIVIAVAGLAAGVYWHDPLSRAVGRTPSDSQRTTGAGAPKAKQLWTCSMHPQVIQDKPGLCPICHMQLVPLKAATDAASSAAPAGIPPGQVVQPTEGSGGGAPTQKQREIAYWWDPMMSPPYISGRPGKSPMGMDLVPVYKDAVSGGTAVTIDPVVIQNMGVRTVAAVEAPIHRTLRAVGYLAEPEPSQVDINLRVSGWVEKLYANTPGMRVRKGDPLFELYSPDLQVAIEEAIAARRVRADGKGQSAQETADTTLAASRQKLRQLGLAEDQIDELVAAERAPRTVVFRSSVDGHITDKQGLFVGAAVKAGDRVLRLSDNSTLWLDAQVFERDLAEIAVRSEVTATTEFMPGRRFRGEVSFIHPHLDPATRTALVRVAVENPTRELKQGMYATIESALSGAAAGVLIPRDAVLDTGKRQIVFLALAGGKFEPRRVEVGMEDDEGRVQVLAGLAAGDVVVTSGQFLLDSESRLREAIQKFLESKAPGAQGAAPALLAAQPVIAAITPAQQRAVDALFAAYLRLAEDLGAPNATTQVGVQSLIDAAQAAQHEGFADATSQVQAVLDAVETLKGKALDSQREAFKAVSAAQIALLDRMPPTADVAPRLYILHCSMAAADWVQATDAVANPYYGQDMKECGKVVRTFDPRRAEKGRG